MTTVVKTAESIPADLLADAKGITGPEATSTVIGGLHEPQKRENRSALRALKGRIRFEPDLETIRH